MKKYIALAAAFVFIFSLAGCVKTEQSESTVFSFCGKNGPISVSNGVIVFDGSKEIFYGGDLEVKSGSLTDIAGYTTTIYLANRENVILSNSVADKTGGTIDISGEIGKISGDILNDIDAEKVAEDLWFELKTIDLNGEENIYQLKLKLTKITGTDNS